MGIRLWTNRHLYGVGLRAAARVFDRKPLQCSVYVTDRCNLGCLYCTEHDNAARHPPVDDLKRWIRHARDLGAVRIALVGGEPLLHPDIVRLVAFCRECDLSVSLTTNGLLLTPEIVAELDAAGLGVLQVSVDRVTPNATTRKALEIVAPKLEAVRRSRIGLHLTGVICADTIAESRAVLDAGVRLGIPTEVRLVHAAPDGIHRVDPGERAAVEALLVEMIERKRQGQPIHTTEAVLRYQLDQVRGIPVDWTCVGGYKVFFVSAQGEFRECGGNPTGRRFLDVRREDLRAWWRRKPCQDGCGVYCVVGAALLTAHPARVVGAELRARMRHAIARPRSPR